MSVNNSTSSYMHVGNDEMTVFHGSRLHFSFSYRKMAYKCLHAAPTDVNEHQHRAGVPVPGGGCGLLPDSFVAVVVGSVLANIHSSGIVVGAVRKHLKSEFETSA